MIGPAPGPDPITSPDVAPPLLPGSVVLQGTADGQHTTQFFDLLENLDPQTFALPFTGIRTDGGDTYVRVSLWATIANVAMDSATVTFSTAVGSHHAVMHATGPATLSTDLHLVDSIYSGFLHLAIDSGVGVAFDAGDDYYARWRDGDYSRVTGAFTVTVHRA